MKNTNAKVTVFQQNNPNLMFSTYQTIHRTTKKNIMKKNSKLEALLNFICVISVQTQLEHDFSHVDYRQKVLVTLSPDRNYSVRRRIYTHSQ